ncbi:hypothetical protein A2631_05665 [Candidatus Daviesbacteria bacterium RIFCSPHIGHO2_01_FULL_44_29]|uniref:Rod shape-determining protein MreD n=1 Tax=Candidatus Daviesbacteria bacterium RIFCSPHIGHO2_02_FULL_43_12 TaxID=1797776 RepID=A0A1F5KIL5_9BACT|nr:MAG: hypothetical protein A2631_05665 [Candidatus Daviesbacteria bacterium RIFCSPHIGHO2_01_FULL_44_29]OGE39701.1 MAG: hypothetical protein A3E86_00180 [Candidatus Daviesbacteria bacterium RIFCSPHIGHO2_12_FULL_47_45]OGE40660.1 MAG: hypothetical protein A3D25_05890 [Candidatus Daviesbacteria bacterium RIFCSPHIGHO2_02_FULL_43_12]OGE69844.1 MAG: hypothetical protein A3B55_05540 [Candidatus Daviesbacteria bacterium RIFCSPLOWO2_01_FULL_43_15]
MRFFILLILAAFLQTSFLPIDLCLLLIICRNLLVSDRSIFWIAFTGGLVLGFLSGHNLGLYPIIFLVISKLTQLFKNSPLSSNMITSLLFAAAVIVFFSVLEKFIFGFSISWMKIILDIFLIIPLYLSLLYWEERFVIPTKNSLVLKKSLK